MDRFPVGEKNYPEVPVISLRDLDPTADAAISLYVFFDRGANCASIHSSRIDARSARLRSASK